MDKPFGSKRLARLPAALEERLRLALRQCFKNLLHKSQRQAMKLPTESRAVLADQIVESLDLAEPDVIQRLWAAEAVRRRNEVRSGQVKPLPGEEVIAEVRRMVGR